MIYCTCHFELHFTMNDDCIDLMKYYDLNVQAVPSVSFIYMYNVCTSLLYITGVVIFFLEMSHYQLF